MSLVRVEGSSKRLRQPRILSVKNSGRCLTNSKKEGVLSIGKLHFRLASRLCRVHGGSNPVEIQPHYWPLRSAQHYNRYFAATEVLLIAHVLIGRKKHVEIRVLRFGQQFAVGERVPSSVFGLCDGVTRKEPGNAARRYVVKQNEHPQRNLQREWGPDQGSGRQIQVPR